MEPFLFLLLCSGAVVFVVLFLQLATLRRSLHELSERLAALERKGAEKAPRPAPEKMAIPPSPLLTPPPVAPSRGAAIPPPLPVVSSPPPTATPFNWEAFMGVKLFAWLGGLALFLGVVFLVKYSFENNLITPLGRIAIGLAIGASTIALGWWLARGRYRVTAQSLCATGIVILYADLFAAHSFYGLISLTTAFFAMAAVTLFSFLLAVSLSAQVIVILGLLGGFLTPVLLRSGADNAPALFLYIALLDLGVAAVALRKGWLYLLLLAATGTVLLQVGWVGEFFTATKGVRTCGIFLGFEALFVGAYFVTRRFWTSGSSSLRGDWPRRVQEKTNSIALNSEVWATTAAVVAGLAALGFGFWLFDFPLLARRPLFFFVYIFLADAVLLTLPVLGRASRLIAAGAGTVTFALVATWIGLCSPHAPMSASLSAIIIFALLHAATTPASAWRPGRPPLTAVGTVTPFVLLIILFERLELLHPTAVFVVAFVLSAILLSTAIVRRADWLAAAALCGVALLELVWQTDRFRSEEAMPVLIWYGLFAILFVLYPFCSAQKEKVWPWATSALALALQFWLFYDAITRALPNDRMGLLPAAFLLPAALGVVALLRLYHAEPASGDARLAWQGGVFLLFVSLIFPLQFEREWITLGWAVEGLALLWLFGLVPHRGLRIVAVLLLCAAFARLALNPAVLEYHKRSAARIWNWYLYAYGIAALCLFAAARMLGARRPAGVSDRGDFLRFAPALFGSLGAILVFLLLNLEIADYFSLGPTLTFSFSGNFARDMTYSIAWAVFALVLIIAGMRVKQRAARYAGVGLLGVTLAKLFLHDLSDLDELYRIGAFIGVAIILIAASFIYQRFLAPERA